jgi:hypothetical protein
VSSDEPPVVPAERIEELRRELPPPIRPGERGRKTHGRWSGADGAIRSIISGRDELADKARQYLRDMGIPRVPARTSDVELKIAAHMRDTGARHVTVVINHQPCVGLLGCDRLVPILLPAGHTLTVHGTTEQGTKYFRRFTGGARPWWR